MHLIVTLHLLAAGGGTTALLAHLDGSTAAAIISGAVSPFVVAVLVKLHASAVVKRDVAFVLAVLAGVLPTVVYDPRAGWTGYLLHVALAFVVQQSVHRTRITDRLEQATADTGLGGGPAAAADTDLVVPPPGNPGDVGDTSPELEPRAG